MYSILESDSDFLKQTTTDPTIDLFVNNRDKYLSSDLINFLIQTGIDYKKENELHHYKLENNVVISGWFDIIGKMIDKDKTETLFWDSNDSTTNITFANNETHGIREELKHHRTFRLSFDIVLH